MKAKAISIYLNSAGALLIAMATSLFLINWVSPPDYVPPHDPIFLMPLNELFWIIGGISAIVALFCFFSDRPTWPSFLLIWLAVNYLAGRVALLFENCHSLTGYLAEFNYAFNIPVHTVALLANLAFAYLLTGGCIALFLKRRLPLSVVFQKMVCPTCGGRIQFDADLLGETSGCPRCRTAIKLRKSDEMIKTSCSFCKEHIEFPAHALEQRIKCPHCKKNITLKEPT